MQIRGVTKAEGLRPFQKRCQMNVGIVFDPVIGIRFVLKCVHEAVRVLVAFSVQALI